MATPRGGWRPPSGQHRMHIYVRKSAPQMDMGVIGVGGSHWRKLASRHGNTQSAHKAGTHPRCKWREESGSDVDGRVLSGRGEVADVMVGWGWGRGRGGVNDRCGQRSGPGRLRHVDSMA